MPSFWRTPESILSKAFKMDAGVRPHDESSIASSLATIQLGHERQDFLLNDLRGQRTDALVANHAGLVDHVRLRRPVNAVVDADAALRIVGGHHERIAE